MDGQCVFGICRRSVVSDGLAGSDLGGHEIWVAIHSEGGIGLQVAHPTGQCQEFQSPKYQEQRHAIGQGAHIVRGVRLKKENREQNLGDPSCQNITPPSISHDIGLDALHQSICQKQDAENHRQNEMAVLMTGEDQNAGQQYKCAFYIAQYPLATHAGLSDE